MIPLALREEIKIQETETMRTVSEKELIQRAGKALFVHLPAGKTAVLCGRGNNGADGLALALEMKKANRDVDVFLLGEMKGEAAKELEKECREEGIRITPLTADTQLQDYEVLVDCLLGTGFQGELKEDLRKIIEHINNDSAYVLSADIPSGLDADNGLGKDAAKADKTLTMGTRKPGLYLSDGKDHCGEIFCADIGLTETESHRFLLEREDLFPLFPKRAENSHKGSYGKTLILGGSKEYSGAVKLANLALSALRCGRGLSTLAVPESLFPAVSPYILDATLALLKEKEGKMSYDPEELEKVLNGVSALLVGPGWGRSEEYPLILQDLLQKDLPLVLDADALNTLAEMDPSFLRERRNVTVLTPHPREFSRLCHKEVSEVLSDPLSLAENYARENKVILLLKGCSTIITDGKTTCITNTGCAGMAKGGSGDVLSGVVLGLLKEEDALLRTAAAAYLNGKAGELALKEKGEYGMCASDTAAHLPQAILSLQEDI